MKLIVTHVFNLFLVIVEVAQRTDSILLFSCRNVPEGQLTIITSSNNMTISIRIPLDRIAFSLMSHQHNRRSNFHPTAFEGHLIENVNFAERSPGGNQIGLLWMMLNSVHFPIVLHLMLNHYFVLHHPLVFLNRLISLNCL